MKAGPAAPQRRSSRHRFALKDDFTPPDIEAGADCQRAADKHHGVHRLAKDEDADRQREQQPAISERADNRHVAKRTAVVTRI